MNHKKQIRKAFREACLTRDGNVCKCCPVKTDLAVHHITDRNEIARGGYVKQNGITLCPDCHMKAERYHDTNGKSYVPTFHPNDLYELIGSSYEEAVAASERLD